jgi:hypothetical protein
MRNHNGLMIGVGIALLVASGTYAPRGFAQTAPTQDDIPPSTEALPPPTLDDPGLVTPAPTPAKRDKRAVKNSATPPPLPPESAPLASSAQMNTAAMEPAKGKLTSTDPTPPKPSITQSATNSSPTLSAADARLTGEGITVSKRTMPNGDVIEETRNGGQLAHVKVTPKKGPSYEILDTNGDGRIDEKDAPNGVQPVGWTLFKWH